MTRSTDPLITDLLAGRLPDEPCDAIELRVSAQSAKELKDNVDAASTKLGFHPAVAYLKTLDLEALLLDKSAAGGQQEELVAVAARGAAHDRQTVGLQVGRRRRRAARTPRTASGASGSAAATAPGR